MRVGTLGRMCCLQITEDLKCRREREFLSSNPRAQGIVNPSFKRSNFLTLSAIKNAMNYLSVVYPLLLQSPRIDEE